MCPNCILNQANPESGIWIAFGICGIFFVVAVVAILWAFKNGDFEDPEGSKFEMLDDDEDGVMARKAKEAIRRLREREQKGEA